MQVNVDQRVDEQSFVDKVTGELKRYRKQLCRLAVDGVEYPFWNFIRDSETPLKPGVYELHASSFDVVGGDLRLAKYKRLVPVKS